MSTDDRLRVAEAIRAAERLTSGEFVCVLVRYASRYTFYPLAWATLVALVTPWLLIATRWSVLSMLTAQLAAFAVAFSVLSLPALRSRIVPRRVQRAAAHRAAAEQFLIRGLASAPHRCGVLLFVAEEEHYVRVIADDGAAAQIAQSAWSEAVDHLVRGARASRHADGFVRALDHCGRVMATEFPADEASTRSLPDRFFVVDR